MPDLRLKLCVLQGENYTFMGFGVGDLEALQAVRLAYRRHRKDFTELPLFDEYIEEYEPEFFEAKPFVTITRSR